MNISIIGAGGIGCAIAADLARKNKVKMFSTRPDAFDNIMIYQDMNSGESYQSRLELVSNDYEEVVSDADVVFIALPTFIIKEAVKQVAKYISEKAIVGFVPGAGGIEFFSDNLLKKGNVVFGFERVPYVSRVLEYGKIVSASKKDKYRVASIPKKECGRVAGLISELFYRPCGTMNNFISLTLTPTLHTSRLYDLYADYIVGDELADNPFFYGEWRDSASEICFALDKELHDLCDKINGMGLNTSEVVPYPIHYESKTPELLTEKLRSIPSLNKIKGPVLEVDGKFFLDIGSRYFTESYPYRLCIVKGLAVLVGIETPMTDKVLKWYSNMVSKEYYIGDSFSGKDLVECNIPQNYGIDSIDKLIDIYN